MIRISTILPLVFIASFTVSTLTANSQHTYIDNGSSTSYTLYTGDSLHIQSGTYRGTINNWQAGAKISVASGANFEPNNFGYYLGSITVYGTATLSSLNGQTNTFKLFNFGRTTISGTTYLGGNARIENSYGAVLMFNGSVNINGSTLINSGTVTAKEDWYIGNSSTLTNNNIIEVTKNLETNNTQVFNGGKLYTGAKLTLSGGSLTNNCKTIADKSIAINGTTIYNNGLFWATSAQNNSTITNGGTITSSNDGKIKAVNFENNGTINGTGYLYFTGVTRNNSGTIGRSGTTSDTLRIYDVTRTSTSTIFDFQYGTVNRNAVYSVFPAPDTTAAYPSCALAFSSASAALPIKWNYFYVNLADNTPALTWSAEQDNGTVFEVERSYDGTTFSSIEIIAASSSQLVYQYQDKQVNTQAAVVYYRIKAIEPTGAQKISETRTVKFANKKGINVQTTPNPFTSQFSINYQSAQKEMISIRIISLAGQVQLTKKVNVSNGYNSISLAEAGSLAKGIYMVQLTGENGIIATEKVVKQ